MVLAGSGYGKSLREDAGTFIFSLEKKGAVRMKKFRIFLGVMAISALALPTMARADVLWDQGFTGSTVGIAGGAFLGLVNLEENSNKCDDFTLTTTSGITTVKFWCINQTDSLGDTAPTRVSICFFTDNSGLPGNNGFTGNCQPTGYDPNDPNALLPWYALRGVTTYTNGEPEGWIYKAVVTAEEGGGLTAVDSGYTNGGSIIWEMTVTLPTAFVAQADTTYFVGMDTSNQSGPGAASDYFGMTVTGLTAGTHNAYEAGIGTLWGGGWDFHYVLEGVPEPATMSLLGLGGLGLLLRRKR